MDNTKGAIPILESDPSVKSGKNYFLGIGINDYIHCPKLKNVVKDVKDFVNLLTERYDFELANIETLFNEVATNERILQTFESFAEKITPYDNLIIYFSGHGEFKRAFNEGYWIPFESQRGAIHQYIPNSTIRTILNAINSHHTFLIVDSCFSGTLFSSKDTNRSTSARLEREPSRWGLTAGRNEIVDDGKPGTNSPFAEKLLDLLRKNDKPIGVAELCSKMMEIVQANANQTPRGEVLNIKGHDGGQFFFHPRNNETEEWQLLDKTSVLALEGFVKKYPLSINAHEAKVLIQKLEIQEAEANAQQKANIEKGIAELKIKIELDHKAEEYFWLECEEKQIPSLYLKSYPNKGRFTEPAFNLKTQLEKVAEARKHKQSELNESNENNQETSPVRISVSGCSPFLLLCFLLLVLLLYTSYLGCKYTL